MINACRPHWSFPAFVNRCCCGGVLCQRRFDYEVVYLLVGLIPNQMFVCSSPVIVDRSSDLGNVARRVFWTKGLECWPGEEDGEHYHGHR